MFNGELFKAKRHPREKDKPWSPYLSTLVPKPPKQITNTQPPWVAYVKSLDLSLQKPDEPPTKRQATEALVKASQALVVANQAIVEASTAIVEASHALEKNPTSGEGNPQPIEEIPAKKVDRRNTLFYVLGPKEAHSLDYILNPDPKSP